MHIKKYEARDLQDALRRIRGELGPDAVILESGRSDSGGVTVLAAMPREAPPLSEQSIPGSTPSAGAAASASSLAGGSGTERGVFRRAMPDRLETADEARAQSALGSRQAQAMHAVRQAAGRSAVRPAGAGGARNGDRPAGRTGTVDSAAAGSAGLRETDDLATAHQRIRHLQKLVRSDHFSTIPMPLRQLYFELTDAEVDADLVHRILERMGSVPMPGQFTPAPSGDVLRLLRGLVEAGGAVAAGRPRRVIALAGPTGVGKTTTAAKIAGHACFNLGMRVALVSIDAYRVFGAQHLAAYATLMGLPFHVAAKPAALARLLSGPLAESDLVLIDTSGRSPGDRDGIGEIRGLLGDVSGIETHLVMAANGRCRDMATALQAFTVLPVSGLIFTKLDEAGSRGAVFTTALKARLPVSYLGTGQEVPDDLEEATTEALTGGLLGEALDV